ncbi:MAG TPA: hypothetical protein VFR34_07290 [Paracoccaceae bacterium]|nr:hypothetical protein [Paracoccaceae bacterium]
MRRLLILALLLALGAMAGCGRKGDPVAPGPAEETQRQAPQEEPPRQQP